MSLYLYFRSPTTLTMSAADALQRVFVAGSDMDAVTRIEREEIEPHRGGWHELVRVDGTRFERVDGLPWDG